MAKIALNFISVRPAVLKKSVRHRLYFFVGWWVLRLLLGSDLRLFIIYNNVCLEKRGFLSKKEDFEEEKKWVERGEMGYYLCCTTLFLNIYIAVFRLKMPLNGKK